MSLLFHLHTKFSFDSILSPKKIIKFAIQNHIRFVAITDHDTIKGSVDAFNYVKKHNLDVQIIIGAEYYSSIGDIIGLFLTKEIETRNADKLIEEIHKQGGIAILPHPTRGHQLNDSILKKIDMIEIFNARSSIKQNHEALNLSIKYKKPFIAGNDAHIKQELPLCLNQIDGDNIRQDIFRIKSYKSNFSKKPYSIISQMIKAIKTKNPMLFSRQIKSGISYFIVQPIKKKLR